MRLVRGAIVVGALSVAACALVTDLSELKGDASAPSDGAVDAGEVDAPPMIDATEEDALVGGDAGDAGDARIQDNTTIFCGPALACSHADPNNGCCVSTADSGAPPESYVYTCEDKTLCTDDAGQSPFIACDQGSDCPGTDQVCCWPNALDPIHTFCFASDAGNCSIELCDPNDAIPCVNHPGFDCVPTGLNVPSGKTTPLGYFACVAP